MSKMLRQLTLFAGFAAFSAALVTISGCKAPAVTGSLQIETVHEIFPSATKISEILISRDAQTSSRPGNHTITEITDSSGLLGYCAESKVVSRSGPFRIRVFLDRQLVVKQAKVISYPWQHGRDVRKAEFTSQFEGKGPGDAVEIGKDIDVMTGATISCRVMSEAVREIIRLLKYIQENR